MTSENDSKTKEPEVTQTPEPTAIPAEKQKEPAYYIKVNYGANVVTIYKKASSRRIYCTSKGNGMFVPEHQHQLKAYIQ
ncbi:MAG: hypothetical protein HFJ51_00435 [Clostridia bacterium]|nr:hypothetical protein [Clostridia bacterium]